MDRLKLFCIPYSGGTAYAYTKWNASLPENIEICPIELSGHGKRIMEPLYDSMEEAVDDVAEQMDKQIRMNDTYAIWGHSMGSLIAYETYYRLKEMEVPLPCHMFFSGRKSPQNMSNTTSYHLLPDDEFINAVMSYGGSTKTAMENEELRNLFLPILRSDFKISETYIYKPKAGKLACDITIVNGDDDLSVKDADMEEWKLCTDKQCNIVVFPGDHFFLFNNSLYITDMLRNMFSKTKQLKTSLMTW